MTDSEIPTEEVERRARELARRVMSKPPQPRAKPKSSTKSDPGDASRPRKRARAASEA